MTPAKINVTNLEPDIRRIGRQIFERAEAAGPSVFSIEYWQQAAMNQLTRDEELKLRLFRFVEVLPSLQSNEAVARHLIEYLGGDERDPYNPPEPLHLAVAFDRPDSIYASLVASAARFGCATGAKQFIAGDTPQQAIRSVKRLRRGGNTFTLDVLGETIIADRIARQHQQLYIELINKVSRDARSWPDIAMIDRAPFGAIPKVNISIKLSAIVVSFDPINPAGTSDAVLERLRPVLRAARDAGAFVNVDMEHYAVKNLTLDIFKRVLTEPEFRDWPDCGIVIQCYMPEGDRDLAELVAWARRRGTPISVRLVKGAYWDSETANAVRNGWQSPLYKEKWQSDAAYERVGRVILENCDIIRPAFASHNVRTIAAMLAMEDAMGLPPRTLELQMLTGMGEPLRRALTQMKQRLRVYAPFGDMMTGMAYLIRRLIENTANESFLRQSFGGGMPTDQLLRRPGPSKTGARSPLPRPFIQDPEGESPMEPFQSEPEINFPDPPVREAMLDALKRVRAGFGERYAPIINNADADGTAWRPSRNPSSPNEVVGEFANCDVKTVHRAVAAARKAADGWADTSTGERAEILDRAADAMHAARYELMAWTIFETGKTWREAAGDYLETVDYFRFYAHEWRRLTHRNRHRDWPGEVNEYFYAPRGVCAVIGPFCFPMSLIGGMTAAALVTGNTVVMKPAQHSSVCAAKLCRILIDAGLPPGVLNFVTGAGDVVGDALVKHADVDMIAFTGSSSVGASIIQHARDVRTARGGFKHIVAEMGGKNAIIIDDDADIDEAVQATIASAFGYSGQKCTACSRVIVMADIYDAFLDKLKEAAGGIKPKQADDPAAGVGPLINDAALENYDAFIVQARKDGRLILPGGRYESDSGGYFALPAVVADVAADSETAQQEMMAPILAVLRAESFEQAVAMANNAPYGLVGGIYSRSPSHIALAKRRLDVGMLYVNRKITLSRVDRQPFGGQRASGLGTKTGGPDYLQQFCLPRTISENTMRHGFSPANAPSAEAHAGSAT